MSHPRTSANTDLHSTGSSHPSDSITDEESSSQDYSSQEEDNDESTWADGYALDPDDSASASVDYHQYQRRQHKAPYHSASRRHTRSQRQQSLPYHTAPPMATDPSDDYPNYAGHGNYAPPMTNPNYYPPAAGHGSQGGHYAQSHVGFPPPYGGRGNQMVHYNNGFTNPFTAPASAGPGSYYGEGRGYSEVVPYQTNYFASAAPYGPPIHYMYPPHPPPPPTEAPGPSQTPAPEKKVDPEVELMKKKLELLEAEKKAKEEEIRQQKLAEQIRQAHELDYERRREREKKEKEEQQMELEKAKQDAERRLREKMEADMKADEERRKQQADAVARIENETRAKIEAERRAEEERKKREADIAAAAEATIKAKMEAAEAAARAKAAADFKAEVEAKEAAEKKVKEEIEWRKKLEEEAKLKAEIEARAKLEEEKKKADEARVAEENRKKAEEALKKKIVEETKLKIQEEAKKGDKAPIRFKDAVGRKFSFPFHLCQTWQGMDELIKQAFQQVEGIGAQVQSGQYDLIGPDGEIILPTVWEKVIQPDWSITMHMWRLDHPQMLRNGMMGGLPAGAIPVGGRHHMHPGVGRSVPIPMRGGIPQHQGAGAPRAWPGVGMAGMHAPAAGVARGAHRNIPVTVVNGDHGRHHDKKKGSNSKSVGTGLLAFMGGKPSKPVKKKR